LQETDSTNDTVRQAAQRGEPEGLVVTANRQKAGRGRQNRVWLSDQPLGLYVSLLLRPDWPVTGITRLTLLSGLAAAEALEAHCHLPVALKWPNDLMVQGRKLGGILVEAMANHGRMEAAILGFGLNLNQTPEDFPEALRSTAVSLSQATGQLWRRAEVLVALLTQMEKLYNEPPAAIHERWSARCVSLGKTLSLQTPEGLREGQALGVDEDGRLLLRLDSGKITCISVGEIVS
jgi:BirA family biotin operon repressor/biotin-[acetyl-CoA-carboxylase] ligase